VARKRKRASDKHEREEAADVVQLGQNSSKDTVARYPFSLACRTGDPSPATRATRRCLLAASTRTGKISRRR